MRRGLTLVVLLCALSAFAALAYDFSALKPSGYVSDFAGVVDEKSRLSLERYAAMLERQTGAQLAIVTLESLYGEPIEDVANLLFRRWGIGQKGSNEGVLLLLVIRDRRSRLEVGYGLEPVLPDGFAGSVLRSMRPALKAGHYGPALIEAAHVIGSRIAEAKGVSLDARLPRRSEYARRNALGPVLEIGIMVVVLLLVLFGGGVASGRGRRYRGYRGSGILPSLILWDILSSGGRGQRGGGGFGGFDSGGFGGFGGFGGGSSGGGGASSSW